MFCRKDKSGFRECHFQRDALHDIRVEALRIQEHGELIAGQRTIGKYIKMEVVVLAAPQHSHSLTFETRKKRYSYGKKHARESIRANQTGIGPLSDDEN